MSNKIRVVLQRISDNINGTFGILMCDGFYCYTLEPPWRDNKINKSCIPKGEYLVKWSYSPRYRWVYNITNVENRTHILMHSGNVGGDRDAGLHTHTNGCILLGSKTGELIIKKKQQKAVLNSKNTIRHFSEIMNKQLFELEII